MHRRGPAREGVGVRKVYGIVITDTAVFREEGFVGGRKRGCVETGRAGFKEERLSRRYRMVEIKVAVQLVETS